MGQQRGAARPRTPVTRPLTPLTLRAWPPELRRPGSWSDGRCLTSSFIGQAAGNRFAAEPVAPVSSGLPACRTGGPRTDQRADGPTILELWVPAEELDDFNAHIVGEIQVVHEFR
ncbi:hypothetical protein ACIBAB_22060 [Streptomyces rubiginosohelvolus]|uniref:hypothetical protein n=1 Tax=Streptomyces rubiginosohelvolus TaxID=67362 RepID=UPI003794FF5C